MFLFVVRLCENSSGKDVFVFENGKKNNIYFENSIYKYRMSNKQAGSDFDGFGTL